MKKQLLFTLITFLSLNSYTQIQFEKRNDLDINSGLNFNIGLGYNYRSKYSIELRVGTNRDLLDRYTSWSSNYQSVSLSLGYNLF